MAASSIFGREPNQWSSCSVNNLNEGFNSRISLSRCLGNEPTMTVGDPVCGNGIQEENEACDCGSQSECTNPCCNANTCQLAAGAVCSRGPCCTSQCQFVTAGTSCRASTGGCDILEYCPGDSSECPNDEHVLDGTACTRGGISGFCYSGDCPTHEAQCQATWCKFVIPYSKFCFRISSLIGLCVWSPWQVYNSYMYDCTVYLFSTGILKFQWHLFFFFWAVSSNAPTTCYNQNTRGDQFGNCGAQSGVYSACASAWVTHNH